MANTSAHGFAALNGGTTGGSGGRVVVVKTGAELQSAINSATGAPLTIQVAGTITTQNSKADGITIAGKSDITIVGAGGGAEFNGIGIRISDGSSNIIVQNLRIHDVRGGTGDALSIEGNSKNIWIDHNELYSTLNANKDYYDGLLDIKRGAEYITISNNYLHDHHKSSLVGYSDADEGARYITYNDNVFENVGSRTPSVRDGFVHIYDNYFHNVSDSGINLRMGAVGLIENNVFENVRNPIVSLDSAKPGFWDLGTNQFRNVSWSDPGKNEATAEDGRSTASYSAPYAYTMDRLENVKLSALANAGVGVGGGGTPPTSGENPTPVPPPPTKPVPVPPDDTDTPSLSGTKRADVLKGTDGGDIIDGLAGYDTIDGGRGNDVLRGGDGKDQIAGGQGNDTVWGGSGDDRIGGGDGTDLLHGDGGKDTLEGGGSDDTLDGGSSQDVLLGGAGNDILNGGAGSDLMYGGAGDDHYIIDSSGDKVFELAGEGRDTIWSSRSVTLGDSVENAILTGSSNLSVEGNALDNILVGNLGNNVIIGHAGNDAMAGGAGRDQFVFHEGESGHDVITDFTVGSDVLKLKGYDAKDASLTQTVDGTRLDLPHETILLKGTYLTKLSDDWAQFR